jgi:pentose-5-phosphate-3-epimerase
MKMLHAAALATAPIFALTASPVLADDHAEAPGKLTIDSSIEALMGDEAAKAVVLKHLGPLDQHPFYGQFKGMTLMQVQPMSNGQITAETIEKIKTELAAL